MVNMIPSALCLNYLKAISCSLTRAHAVFRNIRLVVKETDSQLPGMIYITMVTLGSSPLELVPSDELQLHSIGFSLTASVSQFLLGMLYWVEAPLIHQCLRTGAWTLIGKVTVVNPLVSMTTVFCSGSQSGIYELFISQRVCELVLMHYILRSHTLTVAHTHSHLSLCWRTAVEVCIFPDLSGHNV